MTISASDLKLRVSENMTDSTSTALGVGGGGRMGTAVLTGTPENDVFPDVTSGQRLTGAVQFRKVWMQALSDENDALAGSAVALTGRPSDANCRVVLFKASSVNADDLIADLSNASYGFGVRARASVALTTAAASVGASTVSVDRFDEPYGLLASDATMLPNTGGLSVVIANGSTREVKIIASTNSGAGTVTFTTPLANAFASGSTVSVLLPLGDLQAAVNLSPFSQQTWQRVWSDTVTTPATAAYSGVPSLINAGAITDRWSIVFRTSTAFDLVSERYGQLVAGTTTADFIPVNPATNQPYFTLLAAGWGSGWLPGNCLRFNTMAAAAPFWLQRTILAGSSAGTVNAQITMTGDVNA